MIRCFCSCGVEHVGNESERDESVKERQKTNKQKLDDLGAVLICKVVISLSLFTARKQMM